MLFKAVYPALVRAKPPRRPAPTLCVIRRETDIEIPEISTADAPHVMTVAGTYVREVQDWGGPVPVRKVAGRYYRPVLTVDQFAQALARPLEPVGGHSDRVLARSDVFEAVRSRIAKALFGYQGPSLRFWPTDIEHFLRQSASRSSNLFSNAGMQFDTAGGKIALDEEARAQADEYLDFFIETLSEHAVIDGHVWRETLEPVYAVSVKGVMSAVFPESLAALPGQPPDIHLFDSTIHFFSADCREEAIEFAREYCNDFPGLEHMLATTRDAIEVIDPAGLSGTDTIRLGMLAAARDLFDKVRNEPMTDEGQRIIGALGDAIQASDARTGVAPALEDALANAVALQERDTRWVNRHLGQALFDQLRLHLHRQDDRSCTVPFSRNPTV